jgi:hypothetical protein
MDSKTIYSSLPFERSYWVIPGRMLAGGYPGDPDPATETRKLSGLLEAGVQTVINLMEVDEVNARGAPFLPYKDTLRQLAQARQAELDHLHYPIAHLGAPSYQQMRLILDTVDDLLAQGRRIYLHSRSGNGRTGTVVGCFLARHGLASGEAILERLAHLRQGMPGAEAPSPETAVQQKMVLEWREGE